MNALILHLKHKYFEQIASGEKTHEFRVVKPYWEKRLIGKSYDVIKIWDGFKPGGMHTVCSFPYRGFERRTIQHEEFGPNPVEVYAIPVHW
jgi:hypothetical protein